jgi:hypothetical protein
MADFESNLPVALSIHSSWISTKALYGRKNKIAEQIPRVALRLKIIKKSEVYNIREI